MMYGRRTGRRPFGATAANLNSQQNGNDADTHSYGNCRNGKDDRSISRRGARFSGSGNFQEGRRDSLRHENYNSFDNENCKSNYYHQDESRNNYQNRRSAFNSRGFSQSRPFSEGRTLNSFDDDRRSSRADFSRNYTNNRFQNRGFHQRGVFLRGSNYGQLSHKQDSFDGERNEYYNDYRHTSGYEESDFAEQRSFNRGRSERRFGAVSRPMGRRLGSFSGSRDRDQDRTQRTSFFTPNSYDARLDQPMAATYVPDDNVDETNCFVKTGINFDKYEDIEVNVTGDNIPGGMLTFKDGDFCDQICSNILALGYNKPTPVQKVGIPIIAAGRDLSACAQTGSGKTAAFLLPIMQKLISDNDHHDSSLNPRCAFPRVLILAPTRELVRQTYINAKRLAANTDVTAEFLYGGVSMSHSRERLLDGCDVLVATTGRVKDFVNRAWICLKYVKYFVLDEADRMLEQGGFYEDVQDIIQSFDSDSKPQTLMFSATFPAEINNLGRTLLRDPVYLEVGIVGSANRDVKQEIVYVKVNEKRKALEEYLETMRDQKSLIFCNQRRAADTYGLILAQKNYKVQTIHGAREQFQREEALAQFRQGIVQILIASNVAARGLDIPEVDNVINFDMPTDIDTYVHRIGRTGRCGNPGRSITFYDPTTDSGIAKQLIRILHGAHQEVPSFLEDDANGQLGMPDFASSNTRRGRENTQTIKLDAVEPEPTPSGGLENTVDDEW